MGLAERLRCRVFAIVLGQPIALFVILLIVASAAASVLGTFALGPLDRQPTDPATDPGGAPV